MIRWESVLVAAFGTLGGVGLGLFFGWGLVQRAPSPTRFSAPGGQLAVILIVGGPAGALTAIRPARRAARIDVLAAIASA